MDITTQALAAQYRRALAAWPFIPDIERVHGLPPLLLFAVGSRETNLVNEVGDGGHGFDPWQLDNRSHQIPPDLMSNTAEAADIAASILVGNLAFFAGNLLDALCAYNAGAGNVQRAIAHGHDANTVTAHGNYGRDVLERLAFLSTIAAPPAPVPAPFPWELDLQICPNAIVAFLSAAEAGVDGLPADAGYELHADGGIDAVNGAPFFGGYWNLDPSAHNVPRIFLGITPRRDAGQGYELRSATDAPAYYTCGPGLNGFAT